jgi:hypothetical protein
MYASSRTTFASTLLAGSMFGGRIRGHRPWRIAFKPMYCWVKPVRARQIGLARHFEYTATDDMALIGRSAFRHRWP